MKKNFTIALAIAFFTVAAFGALSLHYQKDSFCEGHLKALDSKLVRIIEVIPFSKDQDVVVFYETTEGFGAAHFKRMPLLHKWQVKEQYMTRFENGLTQNYVTFEIEDKKQDFRMVYDNTKQ